MLVSTLYFIQEKILFLPTVLEQGYRFQFNHSFEEINIKTEDSAILNAIHFKVDQPKGVILYFHGNAGNLSRWGTIAEFFVERGFDVLIMDYRTYGKSTGKLNEDVFYKDADLFYKYVKDRYNENDITLYGRSLGTAIATYLASKNKPKQLVLETPYYSMIDVGESRFPIFPVSKLLKYKFPTYQFIKSVRCPITMFHGTKDQIVPYASAKKLFELAPKPQAVFITIEGGFHNDLLNYDAYKNGVEMILK